MPQPCLLIKGETEAQRQNYWPAAGASGEARDSSLCSPALATRTAWLRGGSAAHSHSAHALLPQPLRLGLEPGKPLSCWFSRPHPRRGSISTTATNALPPALRTGKQEGGRKGKSFPSLWLSSDTFLSFFLLLPPSLQTHPPLHGEI